MKTFILPKIKFSYSNMYSIMKDREEENNIAYYNY